jgi:hypothetical protein
MTETLTSESRKREAFLALKLWLVFIIVLTLANGTILFLLGIDMHGWTYSTAKSLIFAPVIYCGLFLIAPLILVKGSKTVRQPIFIISLAVATVTITLWVIFPFAAAFVLGVLILLHWRYDLSGLGFQSKGWKGDAGAVLLIGFFYLLSVLPKFSISSISLADGLWTGLRRLFANPASTTENLFYFGFLTERLSYKTGRWLTPPIIGAMYTIHEMSNPEYWYGGVSFVFIFIGVTLFAAVYLWRRSTVVLWLGDGLGRFISRLS